MKTNFTNPKLLVTFAALLVVFTAGAQTVTTNIMAPEKHNKLLQKWLLPGSSMFLSGLLDGTCESINYHYANGFAPVFPHANPEFWNPAVSWVNKYKDNNPNMGPKYIGSTTFLTFTTDAYHALRTGRNCTDALTLAFYINNSYRQRQVEKPKFKKILLDALILAAIRNIGFCATYSLIFREGNHI